MSTRRQGLGGRWESNLVAQVVRSMALTTRLFLELIKGDRPMVVSHGGLPSIYKISPNQTPGGSI